MAWAFGESWDPYAAPADAVAGYWDSGTPGNFSLTSGRFAGSQAFNASSVSAALVKSSAVNDAVHHITVAYRQVLAISGTTLGPYFQLSDGATNQVCVVFRSDGAILLTSATAAGTVLATYTGAVTAANTWFQFEFEIIINATTGRFRARKNGNTVDDFDSGATLNTRPGANPYANKMTFAQNATFGGGGYQIDDLLWRSDASSVPWVGDIRCYTRMPASDAAVQFARSPASYFAQTSASTTGTAAASANNLRATSVTSPQTGTLVSLSFNFSAGITGRAKMAVYDASGGGGLAGNLLASSVELTNPGAGVNVFTVSGGLTVTRGTVYWVALWSDVSITGIGPTSGSITNTFAASYTTSFPASMVGASNTSVGGMGSQGMNITPTNATLVNETLQDGTTSYVFDATVNDADFYTIAALASTPATVVAVTTRGFIQKSDAGTRGAAVQLKSGATTVTSTPTLLSSSFGWLWRTDLTDPATSSPWTAAAVNNVTIGPKVTS
jgi:hypothetical protein